MSEDPSRLEAEWVEPEQYLGPKMKRITFQCPICTHMWVRTYKAEPKNDPACPNKHCADTRALADLQQQVANLTAMIESGRAPAHIGDNPRVKAVDSTAEIVMADNRMTDLKDNIRQGETMAPKLPPVMQSAADNFFSGGAKAALGTGETARQRWMKTLGARAMAGGMRDMAIAPNQVLPKTRPPVQRVSNAGYDSSRPTAEGNRKI